MVRSRYRAVVTVKPVFWMVLGTLACAGRQASDDMSRVPDAVGQWSLVHEPVHQPSGPGIRLTIAIDSVRGTNVYGRLVQYFAGNVGADPSVFRPFTGTVSADGSLSIPITPVDPAALGLVLVGRLGGDSIHLRTFVLGPDTVSGTGRWLLLKQ